MSIVQETTSAALPAVGVEVSFGTLTPTFDYLDVYVDASAAGNRRIQWRLYSTLPGAAPELVADSLPVPSSNGPYLPFPQIAMIAGASYEIKGIAVDGPCPPIVAGFAGSDAQVNSGPPSVANGSFVLKNSMETVFATVAVFHTQWQVGVSANGAVNTASTWRLYGIITGAGGTIRAQIAVGQFADVFAGVKPYIVISTANDKLGQPVGRARGANSYQVTGISLDASGSSGPVVATLAGFDANLDVLGGLPSVANALAAGIIYRPVIGPPPPPVDNVFPTWPGVMAALAQTHGNVNIEIDDSIVTPAPIPSAGMPAGGWDMGGRVTFTCANPATEFALVSVPDGATLKNLIGWNRVFLEGAPGASGLPSLSYTAGVQVLMAGASQLVQNGTIPLVTIADGVTLIFIGDEACLFQTSVLVGAEIFDLLGPAATLALAFTGGTGASEARNMVAGPGGLVFDRDITSGTFLVNTARFTGPINFTLFEGLEQKQAVQIAGAVTYVVDAAGIVSGTFDEIIFCQPVPAQVTAIQLPDPRLPMNKARILRVIDDNGGSVGSPISLIPFPGTLLNGGAGPVALSQNWNQWLVTSDAQNWSVNIGVASAVTPQGLAASIVFRPGVPTSGNQYATWPEVMTAFGLTTGPVTISVDDTAAAATVTAPGVYDFQGRATFVAEHLKTNPPGQTTLNVPDTATLLNVRALRELINVAVTPTTTDALGFSADNFVLYLTDGAGITSRGTRQALTVAAASSVNVVMTDSSFYDNSVAPFPAFASVPLGSNFSITSLTGAGLLGAPTNTVIGAGGLILQYDASWQGDPTLPGFTGALLSRTLDASEFVSIDTTNILPAPTSIANTQTAVLAHYSPPRNVAAAAYTVDSAGFDQTIFTSTNGALITIPDALLWKGREITVESTSGTVASPNFTLVRTNPANEINGVLANYAQSGLWGVTIKSDGTNWWLINGLPTSAVSPSSVAAESLVYQPGGVTAGNVFATWAALMAVFNAMPGAVHIVIDTSKTLPPGSPAVIPVGTYDMQGRATISSLTNSGLPSGPNPFTPLTIADGAQLRNLRKFSGTLFVKGGSLVTPPLAFDPVFSVIENEFGVTLQNTGKVPFIASLAAGQVVYCVLKFECVFDNTTVAGSGPLFDMPVAPARALLSISASPTSLPAVTSVVTGILGTSFTLEGDASIPLPLPTNPLFFGATAISYYDHAQVTSYNNLPASPAPATFVSPTIGQPTVQTAVDAHRSPQRTINANYTIDALAFDGTIFSSVAGVTITFPLAASWDGREITIKDTSGTAGGPSSFTIAGSGGNLIDNSPVNGPPAATLVQPDIPYVSVTFKSDGLNTWWII